MWASRVVGSRFQHGQERAGRLGVAAQDMQGQPKVVADGGVVQPESNRLTTAGDGLFELAEGTMDFGQRGVEDGHVGLQGHGLADQLGGQTSLALLMAQHPQQVKSVGMGSIAVQNRLIQASRSIQVARLVKPDRSGKFVARDRDHGMSRFFQNPGRHCPNDDFDRAILAVESVG